MRRLLCLLVALAMAGLVTACGSDDSDSSSSSSEGTATEQTAKAEKKYVIGFSAGKVANPTARAGYAGFKYEAEKLGMEVKVNDANLDINKQVADIDQFTNQKVDAIVVHLIGDPNAVLAPLQRATKAGIKIFSLDGLPPLDGVDVSMNGIQPSEEMGKLQAEWIAEKLGGKGQVAVTGGPPVPLLEARYKSATETFKKAFPDIELIKRQDAIPDDPTGGRKLGAALLQRFPDLKAMTAVNDDIAAGMGEAVEESGREVLVLGMNGGDVGMAALKEGRIDANWDSNTLELGQEMAQAAKKILDGETPAADLPVMIFGKPEIYLPETAGDWIPPEKRIDYPEL